MKLVALIFALFLYSASMAKGLVVNIQYCNNESPLDSMELRDSLLSIDYTVVNYTVSRTLTIQAHADRIRQIIEKCRTTEKVFLLSDRLSTFVGLEVISKGANVHGLITLSGAFGDGKDYLYNDISIKKNIEMMDSISFDGTKEKYLNTVYQLIYTKTRHKHPKLPKNSDETMQKLYTLLCSPYGVSIVDFSLANHLSSTKSWIGMLVDTNKRLEHEIDLMNLSVTANKYGIRYTAPMGYNSSNMVRQIKNMIVKLQKDSNRVCGDSIACNFVMNDATLRSGFVLTPQKQNKKAMVIFVNHRMLNQKEYQQSNTYLVNKLLDNGFSCCFYDNRPLHTEDSTSTTTLFDMADDAAAVYNSLRKNNVFKGYKIGYIGASEAGASALLSASITKNPSFLMQLVTNVSPQEQKDLLILTDPGINPLWITLFINTKDGFGMPYYAFSSLFHTVLEKMKYNQIGDKEKFAQSLYHQYEESIINNKENFVPFIVGFLHKQIDEDNMAPRLWWNAREYYKKVKCPILFLSAFYDQNVLCSTNIVEFEKAMHENGNKNYTSVIVKANHNLQEPRQAFIPKHYGEKDFNRKKENMILDSVCEWLIKVTRL